MNPTLALDPGAQYNFMEVDDMRNRDTVDGQEVAADRVVKGPPPQRPDRLSSIDANSRLTPAAGAWPQRSRSCTGSRRPPAATCRGSGSARPLTRGRPVPE